MSSFHADFKLLTSTVDSLENAKDVYRPDLINFLHKNRDKIIEIGEEHDNCFSLISTDSIENSFDNYSFEMSNLSSDVQTSMDSIYQYSIGSDENISLLNQQYKVSSSDLKNSFYYLKKNYAKLGLPLSEVLSQNQVYEGYDADYYNKLLSDILNNCDTQRDKVVSAGIFMSSVFPHLPYFWGGGHTYDQLGVDPEWGSEKLVTAVNSKTTGTYQPSSLDCSGYVDWLFYNSGFVQEDAYKILADNYCEKGLGTSEPITADDIGSRVQPGDLAHMDGHIGVVVSVNDNVITVSHCSGDGCGMTLTNIDLSTGLVVDDSSKESRIGQPYFSDIIHIDYDDDNKKK